MQRIFLLIPVMLGVMVLVFIFQYVSPDDPALIILGAHSTEEEREAKRDELGLNDPIPVQFFNYLKTFVTTGSLGTSYRTGLDVTRDILRRLPTTAILAFGSVIVSVLLSIPLGVLAAVKQYTPIDSGLLAFSVIGNCIPNFWLALLLITLFAVNLRILPTSGIGTWKHWVLPIIVSSLATLSQQIRLTRSSMLECIRQDYVRTARAKGQKEWIVVFKHALRNSLLPVITSVGAALGRLLGGAIIIEAVFGIPGVGLYAVEAIRYRDYPAVMGCVVFLAFVFSIISLLVDFTYVFVDPRVKSGLLGKKKASFSKTKLSA